jgi:large subunit ribosomal protein L1
VEFRVDKGAIVHAPLGKASFGVDALYANAGALALALLEAKPKVLRGAGLAGYVLRVHLAPTMGASVEVAPSSLVAALEARRAAAAAEQQAGDGGA